MFVYCKNLHPHCSAVTQWVSLFSSFTSSFSESLISFFPFFSSSIFCFFSLCSYVFSFLFSFSFASLYSFTFILFFHCPLSFSYLTAPFLSFCFLLVCDFSLLSTQTWSTSAFFHPLPLHYSVSLFFPFLCLLFLSSVFPSPSSKSSTYLSPAFSQKHLLLYVRGFSVHSYIGQMKLHHETCFTKKLADKKIPWVKIYNEIKTAKRAESKVRQTKSPSVMLWKLSQFQHTPRTIRSLEHDCLAVWTHSNGIISFHPCVVGTVEMKTIDCTHCFLPHIYLLGAHTNTHTQTHTNSASFEMQVEAVYAQGLVKRSRSLALLMHA